MPLYVCDKCGAVENTALTNYWVRMAAKKSALCSECDPQMDRWHDLFPKRQWDGNIYPVGHARHVINRETAEQAARRHAREDQNSEG